MRSESDLIALAKERELMLSALQLKSMAPWMLAPHGRSKVTCAQMKRKAAKRKAKRRARRLGHA